MRMLPRSIPSWHRFALVLLLTGALHVSTRAQVPQNLRAIVVESGIQLAWEQPAVGSELPIAEYRVYRDTEPIPDDDPEDTDADQIGQVDSPDDDSEISFTDSDTENGTTYYYRITSVPMDDDNGDDDESDFSNQASATTPPAITITDPDVPTPDPQDENESITVEATLTSDLGIQSATLHVRRGGASSFNAVSQTQLSGTEIDYEETIDASSVTARGLDVYLTATDRNDQSTRVPEADYFSIPVETSGLSTEHSGGTTASAFRLISFPLDLDDPRLSRILEDNLGPLDAEQWRLFGISPNGYEEGGYVEIQNPADDALPGEAFWLITRDDATIDTGEGISLRTDEPFFIDLQAGWNLIGNPFVFDIPLSKITVEDNSAELNDVVTYNGEFVPLEAPSDALAPFEGYAVRLSDGGSGTLRLDPDLTAEPAPTARVADPFAWHIDIAAQVQNARDTYNTAAVAAEAHRQYDDLDRFEPPPIGRYVSLYFPHDDWGPHEGRYRRDVRPASAPIHTWPFEVQTNVDDAVALTFDGVDQVPASMTIRLVDEQLKATQNLRANPRYRFSARPEGEAASFRLIVGPEAEVQRALDAEVDPPQRVELFPNFPNPVSSSTTIRYALPEAMPVTLRVYDVLGREVTTLCDAERESAGYHTVVWDGRGANGYPVASGTYLYRLTAGDAIRTERLVLVR